MEATKLLKKIGNTKAATKVSKAAKISAKAVLGKAKGEDIAKAIQVVKAEMMKLHAAGQLIEATMLRRMLAELTRAISAADMHEMHMVTAETAVMRTELAMAKSMAKLVNMTATAVHMPKAAKGVNHVAKILHKKHMTSKRLEGALKVSDHLVTKLSEARHTRNAKKKIAKKSLADLTDAMADALMHAAKAKYMQTVLVKQQKVQLLGEEETSVADLQEAAQDSKSLVKEMLVNGQDHSARKMEHIQKVAEAVATGSAHGKSLKLAIAEVKGMIHRMEKERKAAGKTSIFDPLDILLSSSEEQAARAHSSTVPKAGEVTKLKLTLDKLEQAESDRKQAKSLKTAMKTELLPTKTLVAKAPPPPPPPQKTLIFVEKPNWDSSDILFMIIGFCLCILGYRLYKPSQGLAGFIFAATITYHCCFQLDTLLAYIISCVSGVVVGVLCILVYPLGVFILGANWGVVIAFILNGICFSRLLDDNVGFWVVLSLLGVACGLLVGCVHKHKSSASALSPEKMLIFSKTSWVGAYLVMRSIGQIVGVFPNELKMVEYVSLPQMYYVCIGCTAVLALLFTFVQMRFTHWEHCGPDERKPIKN